MFFSNKRTRSNKSAGQNSTASRFLSLGLRLAVVLALLLIWAGHPATNPTAETLPDENDVYNSGGIVEFVGPLQRPVPASRIAAKSQLGPAVQAIGSGQINLSVDETIDPAYEQYILDLFNEVYPVIVDLYGQPSNSVEVTVHFDDSYPGWYFYNASADQLIISSYPNIQLPYNPADANDSQWDGIVTHELIHAFHDTVFLYASWPEEGMTEAATEIVADRLLDQGVRDIRQRVAQYNILMSDTWDGMDSDVLGGTTYSFYKAVPDIFYRAAPALFWTLTTSQSATAAGDWPGYDFLERLNQALYDYAEETSAYIDEAAFLSIIESVATEPIDGMPAREWVVSQAIASVDGAAGKFLGIYPSRWVLTETDAWVKTPTNPERIYAFAFERTLGQTPWNTQETLLTSGGTLNFVIENAAGDQVHSGTITLDRMWAYASLDTSSWPAGAYTIEAEVTIGDETLTAQNAFLVGASVVEKEDGVGFVLVDDAGQVITDPVSISGGSLVLNVNGAAVVLPDDLSSLPQAPAINDRSTNVPLPYTRVRRLALTTSQAQSLTGDVNDDGVIDATDVQMVASGWRSTDTESDVNNDGVVDVNDVMEVASAWGAGNNS